MIQEWQIAHRYENLTDRLGKPVTRKRYWGELADASSVYQLTRDKLAYNKHSKNLKPQFKIKDSKTGLVNNYLEYKTLKEHEK